VNKEVEALAKEGKVMQSVTEEQYDRYIALQKGKQGASRAFKQVYNATMGWFTQPYDLSDDADDVIVPLNAARLINRLFAVHGHECLIDGCFNADPHPGNILCVDGKLDRKKNTFVDFIAAADHLIAEKFTAAGNIVAQGRSAGGMLMGAVANMRPDLFAGILGEVPFVDVMNTMCDETLPLTPPEWVEWGDPIRDAAAFDYMASYCPYTNVEDRDYPNVLATGGLTDPRVTYWEPAKWAAKLRHHNTADSDILLYMNMDAGHGGASGRFDRLKEVALSYGFALMVMGRAG